MFLRLAPLRLGLVAEAEMLAKTDRIKLSLTELRAYQFRMRQKRR